MAVCALRSNESLPEKRTSTRRLPTCMVYRQVQTKSPSKRIFPEVVKRLTLVSAGCSTWAPPLMDLKSSLPAHCMHTSFFFFQAEDGIRDVAVTGVQTCALPI